ncbi:Type I restriction-modification system, DNA-methyltransferase subunit M / Type I restriction-modification system, specificity subunit S, partial [hydrothermal vent metagenome]
VDTLPIDNDSLVLDSSCGSGGFLLHALDKVRKQADDYYDAGTIAHYTHWHNFAQHNLFGIEINEQIARTAKMNMIIHDDGHTNVIAADGLLPIKDSVDAEGNVTQRGIFSRTHNRGFQFGRFDFIITNPPFGSSIKQTEQAYMRHYGYALKGVDWLNPKSKETQRANQSTEVLFIEQCHNYLREGGYLAIVLPDGVLTNSSLQYVRDGIEEKYRIVAVVSLPQTAFQATGAGVKSSILFLKKHTAAQTAAIRNQGVALQDGIKEENDYLAQLHQIEAAKKEQLKALAGFENEAGLSGAALKQSAAYKGWRSGVNAAYKEKVDALKERLRERYAEQKQATLDDYPIFMAIAAEIGYDATGKVTATNELDFIG